MSSRKRIREAAWVVIAALFIGLCAFAQNSKQRNSASSPLVQAKAQLAKHELKAAEDSVWKVLSSDPNNAEALLLLGIIRDEQQRYAEAEAVLQKAEQLEPKSAPAHIYLGKTYLTESKLPDALEQYQAAEELAPQNVEVRLTLARLYAATGEFASAMTALKGIPDARFPAEGIPVKVGCLLALGNASEAERVAGAIKDPAVALATAEVFVTSKRSSEAIKLLNVAEASGRKPPPRFYFVKAKALDEAGNQTGALDNFKRAIATEPGSEEFMLALAEFYARARKHAEAYGVLQQAYKNDHDSVAVLRPLILEASFAGKSADVQDAAEHLAAESDDPKDLYIVASVYIKNTRQDEAIPLLQKYLEKFPDDPSALVGLGLGYEDQKKFDEAEKAFERALQADPKFAEAEYQLGVITSVQGNSAAAMQHYENALSMDPNHLMALTKLGGLYLQSGQFDKARDVLLKAESIDPEDRQTEYGLALAYGKLGDREEAKIHMERFQKKGPIGATEKKELR